MLIVYFFVTYESAFKNFFLCFDLTITARWISLFMKGAWFAHINLVFNWAIAFTTDRQASLESFECLSFICKFEFLSSFSTWSLKKVLLKNCSFNLTLLVSVSQNMILVLLGSLCGSWRDWFQMCKSFGSFWAYLFWSNLHKGIRGGYAVCGFV